MELKRAHHRRTAMTHLRSASIVAFVMVALLVGACTSTGAPPTPTAASPAPAASPTPTAASPKPAASGKPVPSPTPKPVVITGPAQAVARVILAQPRLAGIMAFDPNLIGQASWYKVAPASRVGVFVVEVRVGWGDCQAGCIDQHLWVYAVGPDGTVSTVSEKGAPVPDTAWPRVSATGRTGIGGTATAGPVCPVERNPPDPACAPRPVAGAVILIRDATGKEIARVTTANDGTFFADVPAGGYVIEPQSVQGLLGRPSPTSIVVRNRATSRVDLVYDTGIR